MIKLLATITTALLLPSLACAVEPAKPTPTPAAVANRAPSGPATYDSFRLIHTRNVFDPDRRPIRPVGSGTPAPSAPTPADYAALTGTMVSPEKTYAFFSGSRPEFNKVLSVRDKFANATISGITAQSIDIERDGKHTTVLVGQTVPFDNQTVPGEPPADAAPVEISASASASAASSTPVAAAIYRPATGASSAYRPATAAASTPAVGPKAPPANVDEIRRRMMEKRQQELK